MGLGKRLEDIITSRNLKVAQVAQMADVSASTFNSNCVICKIDV